MALQNPYASALRVDPNREKEELLKLKSDPQAMASLGLSSNENFSNLKNDPVKYNKVLSYVKGKAYQSPAYSALESGKTSPEFVDAQTPSYAQTPIEYQKTIEPTLKSQYGIDEAKHSDIMNQLKTANNEQVTNYIDTMTKYIKGEIGRDEYIKSLTSLSTASSALGKGQSDYENAYKRYQEALDLEVKGYGEARTEKRKAAEDMYSAAKDLLDQNRKEEKEYQEKVKGAIYNPATGKYEAKPKTGSGTTAMNKMYTAADTIRKELTAGTMDWGQAYNRIAAQYPEFNKPIPGDATGKTYIDAALGGQAVYNQSGYSPEESTGFAKQGTRTTSKASKREEGYQGLKADLDNMPDGIDRETAKALALEAYGDILTDAEINSLLTAKFKYE